MVVSRSLPHKSVCTSPTRLKNLSGDAEVAGTEDVLNYLNSQFVYYESMKRKLKIKPIYECLSVGVMEDYIRASHTLGFFF